MFPFVSFDPIELDHANDLLKKWEHKMGPICRPMGLVCCHALLHEGVPVAVTTTHRLIRENVGGHLT